MSLLDGTVFEIVKELDEIQQLNERSLLNKRMKVLVNIYTFYINFIDYLGTCLIFLMLNFIFSYDNYPWSLVIIIHNLY